MKFEQDVAAAEDADQEEPVDLVVAEEDFVEFGEEASREAADVRELFRGDQGGGFVVHRWVCSMWYVIDLIAVRNG